jgi:23S rRNA (cytosine1962-C5)-methyltransferase
VENDTEDVVDLESVQKTGFYCDQCENRCRVTAYCQGRRVLDICCYTGGFSLSALKHRQAVSTLGIDSSAPALALAKHNADRKGLRVATFERGDGLKILERLKRPGTFFDVVVCDPPKYARRTCELAIALEGYLRLNLASVGVLAPGGIRITCSCSG